MIYRAPENTARLLRKRRKKTKSQHKTIPLAISIARLPTKGLAPVHGPERSPGAPQPTLLLNFRAAAASSWAGPCVSARGATGAARLPAPAA